MKVVTKRFTFSTWEAAVETFKSEDIDVAYAGTEDGALSILQHKLEAAAELVRDHREAIKGDKPEA